MSQLYTEIIRDAYRNPQHRGQIPDATFSYEDENPLCGDVIRVDLRVENGVIVDARFDGRGCAISQAAAELLLDLLQDQPIDAVRALGSADILQELGIPSISPARLKCALLPLGVVKDAVGVARH